MRYPAAAALFFLGLVPAAASPSAQEIIQKSCDRDNHEVSVRRQYTWTQHTNIRQVEKNGGSRQRENKVFDVFYIDGTEYRRLLEKDGKPLSEKDVRQEKARLDKAIDKQRHESESERHRRQEKDRKDLDEERKLRVEIPKAYEFQLLGEEAVNGRSCWKIRGEPKKGYNPPFGDAKWLPKLHGTVWVDKQNFEWAKVDAESLDSFSVGLGMLRIGKGFRVLVEQQFVNNEIWAPVSVNVKANARALLFLGGNFDVQISFKDYRKYSVSSTVTVPSDQNP